MSISFSGLNIAYRALQAQQIALNVASHNIANANTAGYSRQTTTFAADQPPVVSSISVDATRSKMGTGVVVANISRSRSSFIDYQIRSEQQSLGQWEKMRDALKQVEVVFDEPSDVGLNSLMSRFWNAWQDVVNDPQDLSARQALVGQAENLATVFNRSYRQLVAVQNDLDSQVTSIVDQINASAEQISALNREIIQAEINGPQANDLRDRRDLLLDGLSNLARITYQETTDGAVNVFLGSEALVVIDLVNRLGVAPGASGFNNVVSASDGRVVPITDGELAGLQTARDQGVQQFMDDLQSLAGQLITSINTIHRTGFGLDNSTNLDFFIGTGAADIAVSSPIADSPEKVAAAAAADSPGDNTKAVAIGNLQRALTMSGGTSDFGKFFEAMMARLGVETQQADMMVTNQETLVEHLTRQRQSLSGVSLDEETIRLVEYQRAYEAAARVISVIDEMLDRLINGMGIVGR